MKGMKMDRYEITKDDHQLIQKGLEVLEKNSALWKLPPDALRVLSGY